MAYRADHVGSLLLSDAVARSWHGGVAAPVSSVTGIVTSRLRALRRLTGHELGFLEQHSPLGRRSSNDRYGEIIELDRRIRLRPHANLPRAAKGRVLHLEQLLAIERDREKVRASHHA